MKGPEMFPGPLVTQFQSAVVANPGQGPLNHVTGLAQAAAMRTAAWSQQAHDHQAYQQLDDMNESVAPVPLQSSRLLVSLAFAVGQQRHLLEHRFNQLVIPLIGRSCADHQGDSIGVADQVPLAAWLGAVRRVRAGVRPPFKALTEALSMITRLVSNWFRFPSSHSTFLWTLSQRPPTLHSWNRRQQVVGLTPYSVGKSFHGMPPRKTYKMPSRHWRSEQRGAPPLGEGGWAGNRGSTTSQSSSVRRVDMIRSSMTPPIRQSSW